MCSMYAVWGSRTDEGKLYSGKATSGWTSPCNLMTSCTKLCSVVHVLVAPSEVGGAACAVGQMI